jgi:hypothetical protein
MLPAEEMSVRELVSRTTDVLNRASAGSDDIGARYSRLLELLWRSKPTAPASPAGTQQSNDILMQNTNPLQCMPDQGGYVHFSPANDFSWLDLEAVGDYVSGDPGTLSLEGFQSLYQTGSDRSWQNPMWSGDMSSTLLF